MRWLVLVVCMLGCDSGAPDCERAVDRALSNDEYVAIGDAIVATCIQQHWSAEVRICLAKASKASVEANACSWQFAEARGYEGPDPNAILAQQLNELDAKVAAAIAEVAAAPTEADVAAAKAKLAEARSRQAEFRFRLDAARAEAERRKRVQTSKQCRDNPLAKGCVVSQECLDNPLAKGCQ